MYTKHFKKNIHKIFFFNNYLKLLYTTSKTKKKLIYTHFILNTYHFKTQNNTIKNTTTFKNTQI